MIQLYQLNSQVMIIEFDLTNYGSRQAGRQAGRLPEVPPTTAGLIPTSSSEPVREGEGRAGPPGG